MPLCPFDQITAPPVRDGYAYWRSLRTGDALPKREAIDPADVPALLPHLVIAEVTDPPISITYRLVGTAVVRLNGVDFTGFALNQGVEGGAWRDYWQRIYERVVRDAEPLFGRDDYEYRDRSFLPFEWAILPLSSDGTHVDRVLEIEAGIKQPPPDAGPAKRRGVWR